MVSSNFKLTSNNHGFRFLRVYNSFVCGNTPRKFITANLLPQIIYYYKLLFIIEFIITIFFINLLI
jgi:hypothetical protein